MNTNAQDASMSRRGLLRTGAAGVAATAGVAAASGTVAAAYDGWLDDVDNYDGTHDYRGQDEVRIEVGAGENGLLFGPAAVLIDQGTTVVWEWTGEGGEHNVVDEGGAFESEQTAEAGHTFEHTFDDAEEGDVFEYVCEPHVGVGMLGAIAVGDVDDDLVEPGDDTNGDPYGGWFDDVDNYDGTHDRRGQDEVRIEVGAGENGLLFDPAAVLIDEGTTIVWEWTGEGGEHNVVDEGGAFESEQTAEAGHTFEHTFDGAEEGDVFEYVCEPHVGVGMLGAVAVGDIDDEIIGGEDAEASEDGASARELTAQDLGALALGLGFAGALLVPLFYAAHRKAGRNE
ncbi:halocyanin-like protein [Halorubrum alkaliphilum]|uniref:Halocyanin-like protein n=1 Tax=Halorubrum alkaliphilum TaxID=261290 RepID=A0A8T4GC55_9EURY|nr:halocyanin domain-containing protein [Halorubrum alkaliphilum]MBP1921220.1 halocyanin-like protein [Halorubrum alkaliphilum]